MDTARETPGGRPRAAAAGAPRTGARRPSGEPPPLPRPVSLTTRLFALFAVGAAVVALALTTTSGTRVITAVDLPVVRAFAELRSAWLTDVAQVVQDVASTTTFRVVAWSLLAVLLVARRFQHLFVALTLLLVLPVVAAAVREAVARMRPAGVAIIGTWNDFAHPSQPVGQITLVLTLAVALLIPAGPWRRRATVAAAAVLTLVAAAHLYLAVDHPSDIAAGLALGGAVPLVAIRLLAPEDAFPVTYRQGVRAHLDVGGRRGEAIRTAFRRQLGVEVIDAAPFALSGSAGSTPLLVRTPDGPLFAKLYAANHMRSDRWYKLARTIRYGRLEDERPFNSVRRLVEYEDHMLRVLRDAGVPTARPEGIVEITPEREYLLVTELIADAVHIDQAAVDDDIVDQGLAIVRTMWNAGLAHRDIKPANLLVAAGRVRLIDASFAEVRPSPWREAVDLANMLLTLSLCVPAPGLYERARSVFTDDEIAEAFAATRAVTVPSQLRTLLHEQGGDRIAEFRALAPERRPVAIQRWSLRRLGLTLAVLIGALLGLALVVANFRLAGLL
jgi:tRNA A-37 threonylcarbamoyl transferase component Bud32